MILAAEGGFNPFNPETGLWVWTLIAFLAVLYFLAKKVFPKLQEGLADREQRIRADLEQAEETRKEAERLLEDYKSKAAQVRDEANKIADDIRDSARAAAADAKATTEAETREILARGLTQMEDERNRIVASVHAEVAALAVDAVSRILPKTLTEKAQQDLVEQFITEAQGETAP